MNRPPLASPRWLVGIALMLAVDLLLAIAIGVVTGGLPW